MLTTSQQLEQMHRQMMQLSSSLKEIQEAEKETKVTVSLLELDARIKSLYSQRLDRIESDISTLMSLIEDLQNKLPT
jgi:gas vesicle protein